MERIPRRRLLGVLALAGLGGAATQRDLLEAGAPLSGRAWEGAGDVGPSEVESPDGAATIRYDDYGVPHVEAETEDGLYFAVGYAQARDRLFQMDLFRRRMRGQLSAVFGAQTIESDRFHRKMDFTAAASATWDVLQGTAVASPIEAFTRGVNRYLEVIEHYPLEYRLLDYEPAAWTPVDTALIAKQISWGLTGTFWDLERAAIVDALGEAALELYPDGYDHEYPIIRPDIHDWSPGPADDGSSPASYLESKDGDAISRGMVEWLRRVSGTRNEPVGSNNWLVSGEHTTSGEPMLANDPHLLLQVPPVWYEMRLSQGDMDVRGVGLPGAPLVVIGQNQDVAWGITNVGADVIDFYEYEMRSNGSEYRYDDEWRSVESRTETIGVSGGRDRDVTVEKTVHGPILAREGSRVGVSWVGLSGTREPLAIYRYNRASDIDDFRDGLRVFDIPGQNTIYIDAEGRTMYYPAAKYPIRTIEGEAVRGTRVFDGSTSATAWDGFTPYGESTWEGFVDFEDVPHVVDPEYLGTANQRVVDGYEHYLGDAEYVGDPYRATRIYERLDEAVASGDVDAEWMKDLQRDVHSTHADVAVPQIVAARDAMSGRAREYADLLAEWDREMRASSEAALVYAVWTEAYRDAVLRDDFAAADLDDGYYPGEDWPIQHLSPESDWFDDPETDARETRTDAIAAAMDETAARIEEEGWETYGDHHTTAIEHPFPLGFLDYPEQPVDGSANTVFNVGRDGATGSSWRMIAQFDGPSYCVLPGGNSGRYVSEHYDDQLGLWRRGEYKEMHFDAPDDADVRFREGSR